MTAILLARTLLGRPVRTALLLAGFGVGVAVMIVLLAIAGAVGDEARRATALNAGDVLVLPAGIDVEAIQTGSATAFGYRIDHARFLVRQVLAGPRFRGRVAAASPVLADAVLYLRRAGAAGPGRQVYATGALPGADRVVRGAAAPEAAIWRDDAADRRYAAPTQADLLAEIDALHVPPGTDAASSWAEWQYATFSSPGGDAYLYMSFLLGRSNDGAVSVQLRPPAGRVTRYVGTGSTALGAAARHEGGAPGSPADVTIDRSAFRLVGARYAIALDFRDRATGIPVRGAIALDPAPGFYLSPTEVRGDSGFVSGYVVPALRGRAAGWIRIGSAPPLELDGYTGYHDHNWGTWAGVHWHWGQVAAADGALLYGGISAPLGAAAGRTRERGPGLGTYVAALFDREGLVAAFRPDSVRYDGWHSGQPRRVVLRARSGDDSVRATLDVREVVGTPFGLAGSLGGGSAPLVFLQLHGDWSLEARAGGRVIQVRAPGAAETFVPAR